MNATATESETMPDQPDSHDLRSLHLWRQCGRRTLCNTINLPVMHAWLAVHTGPLIEPTHRRDGARGESQTWE